MLYPVRGMYNPVGICITGADFTNEARDNKKQLFVKFRQTAPHRSRERTRVVYWYSLKCGLKSK